MYANSRVVPAMRQCPEPSGEAKPRGAVTVLQCASGLTNRASPEGFSVPIDIAYLRSLFDYNQRTGLLIWRTRPKTHFKKKQPFHMWNKRYAGKVAGAKSMGYVVVSVDGVRYRAHRIIWAMVNSQWPDAEIDHINGDRSDNRIANLRVATNSENKWNTGAQTRGMVGKKGVTLYKRTGRYLARISAHGDCHYLGYFDNANEAHNAYCAAADRLHGEFSNHGNTIRPIGRQETTL